VYGFEDGWLSLYPDDPDDTGWTFNSWEPKSRYTSSILLTHILPSLLIDSLLHGCNNGNDHHNSIDYILTRGIRPLSFSGTFIHSLHYIMLHPMSVVYVCIVEGKHGESMSGLTPSGGVNDMRNMMYPSDHWFPVATYAIDPSYIPSVIPQPSPSSSEQSTNNNANNAATASTATATCKNDNASPSSAATASSSSSSQCVAHVPTPVPVPHDEL
jgi:hypothetical protein